MTLVEKIQTKITCYLEIWAGTTTGLNFTLHTKMISKALEIMKMARKKMEKLVSLCLVITAVAHFAESGMPHKT